MKEFSDKAREICALLLFGVAFFAFLSTTSFSEAESSSPGGANLCGETGRVLAGYLLFSFGYACYALYACVALWGVIIFVRKDIQNIVVKALGLMGFTFFCSAILSHFLKGTSPSMPDHGGLVGLYINRFFTQTLNLGVVGTRITLVLLVMITFLLATDWLYYSSFVGFSRWLANKRAEHEKKKRETARGGRAANEAPTQGTDVKEKDDPEKTKSDIALSVLMEKMKEPEEEEDAGESAPDEKTLPPKTEPGRFTGKRDPGKAAAPLDEGLISYKPPPLKKNIAYKIPPLDLLDKPEVVSQTELKNSISVISSRLEQTLRSFKIEAEVVEIQKGPVITMFEMELAPGIKVEKIRALDDDIAMSVKAQSIRIVAPIPGKSTFGVEVPNPIGELVRLKDLLSSRNFNASNHALPLCLGKDAAGKHLIEDLAKMPHLLVAGSTGSGKSVCLNSIIMSLLFTRTPEQTKLILVDPKMVELSSFKHIPHLMCPVVTDMKKAGAIMEWAVNLMDSRYEQLSMAGVRNIYGYNKLGEKELRSRLGDFIDEEKFSPVMPFIVIIVDELADLMMVGAKEMEHMITRLAQKSRAVGIHLILATQRPSTNVITGLIKANMPTRISFMVASKIDSRVILDSNGAEKLLGQGDMLFIPPRSSILCRAQGTFISDDEMRKVVGFLRDTGGPVFEEDLVGSKRDSDFDASSVDELYEEAAEFIIETQRGSASLLQRKFAIGYTRASRLIDLMNQEGLLGEYKGSQAREVLITVEDWQKQLKNKRVKRKMKKSKITGEQQ